MVIVADLIGAPVARVPERRTFPLIVPGEPPEGVPVSVVVGPPQPVKRLEAERLKNSDRKIKGIERGLEKILCEVKVSE
jgi:hypothetical protein